MLLNKSKRLNTYYKFVYLILFVCIIENYKLFAQTDSSFLRINQLQPEHIIEPVNKDDIVVVSASRSAKKIEDLPVTIYVITRDEILRKGYITLVDVLKSLPGIKVSQPGSAENGEMFMMRGLIGNQYTKVLVNDIPIKPSVTIGIPIEAQLPIRQAERIEVIYGPSSALYGADAAIGVVNIITKQPSSKVFAAADLNAGSGDQRYINFTAGGKAGRNDKILEYSFYGSFYEVNDLKIFEDTTVYHPLSYFEQFGIPVPINEKTYKPTEITTEIMTENPWLYSEFFWEENSYTGSITMPDISRIPMQSNLFGFSLRYKKWDLSYINMYRKTHSSIGRSPYLFKYNNSENYLADYNRKFNLSYTSQRKSIISKSSLRYSTYKLDENSSFGINFGEGIEQAYQFAFSGDFELEHVITYNHKFFEIVGGINSQFSMNLPNSNYLDKPFITDIDFEPALTLTIDTINYDNFGYNPHMFVNFSAFAQGYLNLDKLKIVGGVRAEANSFFEEGVFTPRIAFLYKLNNNHSIRISSGKAYKPPTSNQMFQSAAFLEPTTDGSDSVHYAFIPNIKLRPEYFTAHEVGYRGSFFGKNINIDLAVYYNTIEQLITSAQVDPRKIYPNAIVNDGADLARQFVNSKQELTTLYGIDASIWLNNIYGPKKLSLRLSGTYTQGSEKLENGESIPFLRGIPQYMVKLNISAEPFRRIFFDMENTVMSSWQRSYMPRKDFYDIYPEYAKIDGYYVADLTLGYKVQHYLNAYIKVKNIFNAKYGGIDAWGLDTDLRYNPQYGNTVQFGLIFRYE